MTVSFTFLWMCNVNWARGYFFWQHKDKTSFFRSEMGTWVFKQSRQILTIFLERPHPLNYMQLSGLILEEAVLSHCSQSWHFLFEEAWVFPEILDYPPTSQLPLLWWGDEIKCPLASEKSYIFIYICLCLVHGLGRRGKQGMSRSYLNCSWVRDIKTKGFYIAGKGEVHFHSRCTLKTCSFLYAFQRPKNVFFTNGLLVGKFQELSILFWIVWHFTCSRFNASAVVGKTFTCFKIIQKKGKKWLYPTHHIENPEIQKAKPLVVGQNQRRCPTTTENKDMLSKVEASSISRKAKFRETYKDQPPTNDSHATTSPEAVSYYKKVSCLERS